MKKGFLPGKLQEKHTEDLRFYHMATTSRAFWLPVPGREKTEIRKTTQTPNNNLSKDKKHILNGKFIFLGKK